MLLKELESLEKETGYIITNLQEVTLHKLYSPNLKYVKANVF